LFFSRLSAFRPKFYAKKRVFYAFLLVFCPFLGELPYIFGRLPFIFGDNILYKCTYLSIFATVKITLHI